jgi:hypothetical protein
VTIALARRPSALCLLLTVAAAMPAQEVVMSSGESIPGKVVSVAGHRAKIEAGGALRMVDVRTIDHERTCRRRDETPRGEARRGWPLARGPEPTGAHAEG